jgi:hypothetical protein
MPLDPAYKAESRGIKPVKHVWLEGIKPVFIRDTGVLWISKILYVLFRQGGKKIHLHGHSGFMQMDYKNVIFKWSYLKKVPGLEVVHYIKTVSVHHESLTLLGKGGLPGNSQVQTVKVAKATSQSYGDQIPVAECVFRPEIYNIPTFKTRNL